MVVNQFIGLTCRKEFVNTSAFMMLFLAIFGLRKPIETLKKLFLFLFTYSSLACGLVSNN
jgi:hypothetical protein